MPYNLRGRNWNLPTVSRGRDTRDLVPRGHHGNRGSLTFSIPRKMGDNFLARHANGHSYMHVKLETRGHEHTHMILIPIKGNEFGRKFTLGNTEGRDYRVFFDASAYKWIDEIEPFGSTETTASFTDEGNIIIAMPPVDKRLKLADLEYRPRRGTVWKHKPMPNTVLPGEEPVPPRPEPLMKGEGNLYLVMVPHDRDEKFHTLLRFLKLEAIKE